MVNPIQKESYQGRCPNCNRMCGFARKDETGIKGGCTNCNILFNIHEVEKYFVCGKCGESSNDVDYCCSEESLLDDLNSDLEYAYSDLEDAIDAIEKYKQRKLDLQLEYDQAIIDKSVLSKQIEELKQKIKELEK